VRRLLPFALLGLLTVGVAAGAALGQVESPGLPASVWVTNVLATTAAAGTAHVRFSSVTSSPDPSQRSSFVGSGVVDFTNGDNRVIQVNHQVGSESVDGGPTRLLQQTWTEESVAIGQTIYRNSELILSGHKVAAPWVKSTFPRDVHQAFGLDAGTGAEDAVAGLAGIESVADVQNLGAGTVDGVPSTRYLITNKPLEVCVHGQAVSLPLIAPTTVWVDSQGRLLQTRVATHNASNQVPASVRSLLGGTLPPTTSSTTTTTLTFSDFGAPVHVVAPITSGPKQPKPTAIALKSKSSNGSCGG
jgi:hypothetical protein